MCNLRFKLENQAYLVKYLRIFTHNIHNAHVTGYFLSKYEDTHLIWASVCVKSQSVNCQRILSISV